MRRIHKVVPINTAWGETMRSIQRGFLIAVTFALLASAASPARAQPSPETLQAARDLANVTSASVVAELTANLANEVWPTLVATLRLKNPKIDEATLAELRREFERLQVNAIMDVLQDSAPIYARHFSAAELRAITAFYRTPAGLKALNVMPKANLEMLQGLAPRMRLLSDNVNQRFASILQQRGFIP